MELAESIKDKKLRKMVVEFLNDISLSNDDFKKYPKMKIEEAGSLFSVGNSMGVSSVERDVLNHTKTLVDLCSKVIDVLKKSYDLNLNKDNMIAAAILHDLMKAFEWKKSETGASLEHTGIMLDHTMLAVAELYHRGFPEDVIHIVASHFGESGPTPPRNFEAMIFHHLDNMISLIEFRVASSLEQQAQQMQLMLLSEDMLRKMGIDAPSDYVPLGHNTEDLDLPKEVKKSKRTKRKDE